MKPTLAIALLVVLIISIPVTDGKRNRCAAPANGNNVNLKLDFGNGTSISYDNLEGSTVLNVTESVVAVEYEWYGDLVFVTSIANVSNDADQGLWWQYWVNGEVGSVAANQYTVEDGDLIEWRLGPTEAPPAETDWSLLIGLSIVGAAAFLFLILLRLSSRE